MKMTSATSALLLAISSTLNAQAPASGPRAGGWAAEVSFGGSFTAAGGALLRFRNDRSAWLLGMSGQLAHQKVDDGFGFPALDQKTTVVTVVTRLGARSLRSPGSATRPIFGGGILGAFSQRSGTQRLWDAGVYGELGVARFFGESFSLAATSELQLRRSELRINGERRSTDIRLQFDAVRVAAAVYF